MEFILLFMKGKVKKVIDLKDVDLRGMYRKWKKGLKYFRGFFRSTPFVSLQVYNNFLLDTTNVVVNENILESILSNVNKKNFCIVDLPFDTILDLALCLNNNFRIKPILNVNIVFNEYGLIGSKENISRLINNSEQLTYTESNEFVMLLDYDRYDDNINVNEVYDKLNNQYIVSDDDLPHAKFLRELGYSKVVILTETNVKDDLKEYINFISADIEVEILEVNEVE